MTNFQCSQSERETKRYDFSEQFLDDILKTVLHGSDPYNRIGLSCGINFARALTVAQEAVFVGAI